MVILFSTMPVFGAEPNAARPAAPPAAAARRQSNQVSQPSSKPVAGPISPESLPSRAAPANPAIPSIDEPDSNSVLGDHLRSDLWQSRILPPDPNEDAQTKTALQDLIQRLNAITMERPLNKPAPSKSVIVQDASGAPKDAGSAPPTSAERPSLSAPRAPSEPSTTLSPAMIEKLNHLMQDPNQVRNPLEMADLLFLSNRPAEAAVLYEKALARTLPNEPATSDDRAWILFQLGTSLRQTDMTKARDTYLKLISELPNSPWTELAKANGRLISWYQSAKPQQMISSPSP